MKKFIERIIDTGKEPRVDQYLLLFLKVCDQFSLSISDSHGQFLSVVMPTIAYDNTFEIGI